MFQEPKKTIEKKPIDARFYLAAERTFLAWIRSAIAFLAFGIAIEKFDLFLKFILKSYNLSTNLLKGATKIHYLGKLLIVIGILSLIFGKINFLRTLRDIEEGTYKTSLWLYFAYFLTLLLLGLGLLIYLLFS
ncbi:MAG: YidH family protein [Caldimicrobium sp.]